MKHSKTAIREAIEATQGWRTPTYAHIGLEYVSRLIQLIIRLSIFDAPVLLSVRHFFLRRIFDAEGSFLVGPRCLFSRPHSIVSPGLHFGEQCVLNHNVEIDYSGGVSIGRGVWISQNVLIETHEHEIADKPKALWETRVNSLSIGDDAWICANVIILPGVSRIGQGAIVGAGSIVTKDVGDFEVVAGIPARKIRERQPYDTSPPWS